MTEIDKALRHIEANKDKANVDFKWSENGRRTYVIEFYEKDKAEEGNR